MKVSIYTRNSKLGPSDYYRVIQYFEELEIDYIIHNAINSKQFRKNLDIKNKVIKKIYQLYLFFVILFNRLRSIRYDLSQKVNIVIIQRELFPRKFPVFFKKTFMKLLKNSRVIWDFDDDIFNSGEISKIESDLLLKYSEKIIGISDYSKSLLPKEYYRKYTSLPTTDKTFYNINVCDLINSRYINYNDNLNIIWLGTSSNLTNIDLVIDSLEKVAFDFNKVCKKLTFTVVSNIYYKPTIEIKYLNLNNVVWSRDISFNELCKAHIGIMPLNDSLFSKGKGGFKLIQYLSCGLPIIASNVGFNNEIVSDKCGFLCKSNKEWYDSLSFLASNKEVWYNYSKNSYEHYLNKFNYKFNLEYWKSILNIPIIDKLEKE